MAEIYMKVARKSPCWLHPGENWKPEYLNTDPALLVQHMDEGHVEKAFLLAQFWKPYDCITPNEYIYEVVGHYPERFVPFAAPDPVGGTKSVRELDRLVRELGFGGLKLSPVYNHVRIDDPRIYPLYSKAEELEIPVLVHTGWTIPPEARIEWQNPLHLEEVALAFPDLKLIVAHTGFQWAFEALMMIKKYPNMYGDFAYFADLPKDFIARTLVFAKKAGVMDRLLWGTDYPWFSHKDSLEFYRSMPAYVAKLGLEPLVTAEDINLLTGLNAARMIGWAAEAPAAEVVGTKG
jgi:hypothetical protein